MSTLQQLEAQRAELVTILQEGKRFQELLANPEFKELIYDAYTRDESVRALACSVDLTMDKEQRQTALNMAQATAQFRTWLQIRLKYYNTAQAELNETEDTIEDIRTNGEDEE